MDFYSVWPWGRSVSLSSTNGRSFQVVRCVGTSEREACYRGPWGVGIESKEPLLVAWSSIIDDAMQRWRACVDRGIAERES
jgi:hypothetical protein